MKIQIKNRFTDKVIIEGEAESLRAFLQDNRDAILQGAKIKITQKEDLPKALGVEIVE